MKYERYGPKWIVIDEPRAALSAAILRDMYLRLYGGHVKFSVDPIDMLPKPTEADIKELL